MDGGAQRLIGGLALAAALSACGGDGEPAGPVQPRTPTTTTSSVVDATTTTITAATSTTSRRPRPLPGPVTPSTPVAGKVARWHAELAAGTAASCTRLVKETTAAEGEQDLDTVLILLYRGAGEGCLGRTGQARTTLGQARSALAALSPSQLDLASPRCRPQELLSWAFFTYLGTEIPTTCPPPATTSTTRPSVPSTTTTTRTSVSTTTTSRP